MIRVTEADKLIALSNLTGDVQRAIMTINAALSGTSHDTMSAAIAAVSVAINAIDKTPDPELAQRIVDLIDANIRRQFAKRGLEPKPLQSVAMIEVAADAVAPKPAAQTGLTPSDDKNVAELVKGGMTEKQAKRAVLVLRTSRRVIETMVESREKISNTYIADILATVIVDISATLARDGRLEAARALVDSSVNRMKAARDEFRKRFG